MNTYRQPEKKVLRVLLLSIMVALAVFIPLVFQVWKEGEVVRLARLRDERQQTLDSLQGVVATMQLRVRALSSTRRLADYAKDSLGLIAPSPEQVVVVTQSAYGHVRTRSESPWEKIKRWVDR